VAVQSFYKSVVAAGLLGENSKLSYFFDTYMSFTENSEDEMFFFFLQMFLRVT